MPGLLRVPRRSRGLPHGWGLARGQCLRFGGPGASSRRAVGSSRRAGGFVPAGLEASFPRLAPCRSEPSLHGDGSFRAWPGQFWSDAPQAGTCQRLPVRRSDRRASGTIDAARLPGSRRSRSSFDRGRLTSARLACICQESPQPQFMHMVVPPLVATRGSRPSSPPPGSAHAGGGPSAYREPCDREARSRARSSDTTSRSSSGSGADGGSGCSSAASRSAPPIFPSR